MSSTAGRLRHASAPRTAAFELTGSRLFTAWLAEQRASLAFTTYQAGKLFLIGLKPDGRLSIFERTFSRCMGLGASPGGTLWMSSLYQLWRFENFLEPGADAGRLRRASTCPSAGHTTGDIDIHDIDADADGRPVFVATRFNCLATIAERASFAPLWRPPFIDRLAAEDRCHLNGLAMRRRPPALRHLRRRHQRRRRLARASRATAASSSTSRAARWSPRGLSMPHSPRLHRGRLWLVQSGTGEFGHVDLATGRFEPVCFLPGYARGLAFVGDHAVIGVSARARTARFAGLRARRAAEPRGRRAALRPAVVNLRTGDVEHRLAIEGVGRGALRRRRPAGRDPPDGARLPHRRDPPADHHCPGGRLSRSDRAHLRRAGL